jgi:hypothetical protein
LLSLEIQQAAGPGQSPLKKTPQIVYPPTNYDEFGRLTSAQRIEFAKLVGIDQVTIVEGLDKGKAIAIEDVSYSSRYKATMSSQAKIVDNKIYVSYTDFTPKIRDYFKSKLVSGKGLYKIVKKHKIIVGSGFMNQVDFNDGIKKPKPYVPFGKHFLHREKLGNGILQIRRNGSNTIQNLPTQRISDNLKKVIEELITDMQPSFGSLYGLTGNEKDLYNRIILHTGIDQRLKIPSPELDNDQKDWHRFQVLIGELDAGNDNVQMIKELKSLLIKLSHKKMLPRGQVRAVLEDLILLGY